MRLLTRAGRGIRAALEPLPEPCDEGHLPRLTFRSTDLHGEEAHSETAEATMALVDPETVGYVILAIRSDRHTLDICAHVPDMLRKPFRDGLAALYAGMQ